MPSKNTFYIICLVLIIFISSTHVVLAAANSGDWDDSGGGQGAGERDKLQDALSHQGDYSGSVPGNTQATLSNGQTAAVSGNVVVSGGKITSADSIGYQGASISNAQNFQATGDGFSVGHVDRLVQAGNIIQGGSGIVYSNGRLTAASYDSFTSATSFTTAGTGLNADANEISVTSADIFASGDITFTDIPETIFEIYTDAVIAKPAEGANITVTDSEGNEVIFQAQSNESNITVFQSEPAKYIIAKGILKNSRGNISESVVANNTVTVEMGMLGFQCMIINPVGLYYYDENIRKDFSIHIPMENNGSYKLCLRKLPGEAFNATDGIVDFVNKKIEAAKIFYYRRYAFDGDNLLSLAYENVYESKSMHNFVVMDFDDDMVYVKLFNLSSDLSDENISVTRFGRQEIVETSGSRLARIIFDKTYPNVINRYATNFSDAVIDIRGNTLTQTGATKVKMLSPGDEDVEKAENFMLNYWNRFVKTLMDYLDR